MDPFTLYALLFVGALSICALAGTVWKPQTRPCLSCSRETAVQAQRCPHCGYEYR
jgi:hypothetical protein